MGAQLCAMVTQRLVRIASFIIQYGDTVQRATDLDFKSPAVQIVIGYYTVFNVSFPSRHVLVVSSGGVQLFLAISATSTNQGACYG